VSRRDLDLLRSATLIEWRAIELAAVAAHHGNSGLASAARRVAGYGGEAAESDPGGNEVAEADPGGG
jgi:hypothetical protein